MTHTPTLDRYRRGDLASLPQSEPDPVPGWAEYTEQHAHDLRSIRLGDLLVASFGYFPASYTQADAFAVVDRDLAQGHGAGIAQVIRQQQLQWMQETGAALVTAECRTHDRTAQVFLRAIGFRKIRSEPEGNTHFEFKRSI